MKTIQILFVLALVLLSVDTVSAQYGNNGYGGGGTVMATEEITR
jgi:uncharacterized protein YqgC (DUF456 family)